MNNLVFGKYLPLDSIIHRLDPRAKIIAMFIMLVAIFIPSGFIGYAIISVVLCLVIILAKINFKFIISAFKPMIFMLVFLMIINVLSIKEGTILFEIGKVVVYSGAVKQTLYIVIRLVLMIMITTILTVTTKPLDLTLGIEYLLTPLT